MIRGAAARSRAVAVALALAACDGESAGPLEPDLGSREICDELLVEHGGWQVTRCDDPSRLGLRAPNGFTLHGVAASVELDDALHEPQAWPVVVWQGRADGGSMRWHDQARASLVLDLTLGDACVEATLTLSAPAPALVGRLMPLFGDLRTPEYGSTFEIGGANRAVPRAVMLIDSSVALRGAIALGALDPEWPLDVRLDRGPASAALIERGFMLTPDSPLTVPFALCAADDVVATWAAFGALATAPHARPPGPPLVGWRTGPRPLDALRADAERLADWAAGSGVTPTVLVDGAWFAGRGDWSPGPAFPEGVRAALPDSVDAAVVWPALAVAADGPVASMHPEWLRADCAGDCPQLDPRIPAVRDHLAAEALALAEAGLRVFVTGVPADPHAARALLATLPAAATLDPAPADPPPALGLSPQAGLPLGSSNRHRAELLTTRSWMLPRVALDLGPIELAGRPLPAARQAATLALLAGVRLLADAPGDLADDPTSAVARALLSAPPLTDVRPLFFHPLQPPPFWRADRALAIFNWTDEPLSVPRANAIAPELADAVPLFGRGANEPARLGDAALLVVAPGDAQVWVTVDEPARAR